MAHEKLLAEENQQLRIEIERLKKGFSGEHQQLLAAKDQLRIDREKFEADAKVVRQFMLAFDALRNARLNW
ncbi:MAG: hypothetical protein QM741_10870 [Rudaea sp.]|uniref:hypothetical protein n=1 Tax=Rudaea sp. TaxID=2136325 RepID=UPI0039E46821